MFWNSRKPKEIKIDDVTVIVHVPDAFEQARLIDALAEHEQKGTEGVIGLAKIFMEIAVDDIRGLLDDDGNEVKYPKADGVVDVEYVKGFTIGYLHVIVNRVMDAVKLSEEVKKNSVSPVQSGAEQSEAPTETLQSSATESPQ